MSFVVSGSPWYGIGTKVSQAVSSQEAMELANLNWIVESKKIYIDDVAVPGYIANVRDKDGFVLGIVSEQYKIVQNSDAFSFADNLIGEDVKYDSAGSLFKGKRIYLSAKLHDITVLGQTVENYLIFTNSHDGKGSIRAAIIPVLSTYKNPLNLPLSGTDRHWSTMHSGNLEMKMEQAIEALNFSENYLSALVMETEKLANSKVSEKQRKAFVERLFQINPNDGDRRIENIIEFRTNLQNIIDANQDYKDTQWELINAVSIFVANQQPKRQTSTFEESKFNNIVCGNYLLDNAYKILKVIK